ncbi:MAG: hypothetical protein GOP50_10220 [Candidatus Heimdallarchaeota archaeon]|nr:hypothetical protein [Candidatus Heimdallarchaeota archaeon]
MKIRKQTQLALLTLVMLLTTTLSSVSIGRAQENNGRVNYQMNYTESVPLIITTNSDLVGNASSGDGSPGNPYILEDLNITTTGNYAIYIEGTTSNFIIRNCLLIANIAAIHIQDVTANTADITNNILKGVNRAIRIANTDYVNITDNICYESSDGMYLHDSDYLYLENNTIYGGANGVYAETCNYCNYTSNIGYSNSQYGLYIYSSNFNYLINNTCYGNTRSGIYLSYTVGSYVAENECYSNNYSGIYVLNGDSGTIEFNNLHNNNRHGIRVQGADSFSVVNNTLNDNDWHGIFNDNAANTIIANNTAIKDGFGIFASSQSAFTNLVVEDNIVNGKPLGLLYGLGEVILTPNVYGQLILAFCSGTTVQDYTIHDTSIGLIMQGCDSVIVNNCDFDDNNYGSILDHSSMNLQISNTKCSFNEEYGGIYSIGSMNTTAYNCTANNNQFGIFFLGNSAFNVTDCTSNFNSWYNTRFQGGAAGNIRHNEISHSSNVGMLLYNCDYTNISYNFFENNIGYAIYSDGGSMFNWIHHNAFISNNGGNTQAYDDSLLNMWDDPWNTEGNYWDDYGGTGNYTLDGIGNANDSFPLGEIPPGIPEFDNLKYLILLVPVVFICLSLIRRRRK